jgi:hypothetical protein
MKIGFSTPKDKSKIGAALIRWWTGKPYSHVYVEMPIKSIDMVTVYHASHGKVHFREQLKFTQENVIVSEYALEMTPELKAKVLKKCIELSGEEYGYIELAKIFISDVCNSLGCRFIPQHNGRGYICSELVGHILLELGYEITKPLYLLKPSDIEEILLLGKTNSTT